jgi:hypothetical protein
MYELTARRLPVALTPSRRAHDLAARTVENANARRRHRGNARQPASRHAHASPLPTARRPREAASSPSPASMTVEGAVAITAEILAGGHAVPANYAAPLTAKR